MAAFRFAKRTGLPLITFFHDWWPDIPDVHPLFRRRLEANFRRLYRSSSAALCVSEGMKASLGSHPLAPVFYPIPQQKNGEVALEPSLVKRSKVFKILYFGNLVEYGSMLGEALKNFAEHKGIRLEVRGANPNWPADFREAMRKRGLWKDFAPRNEVDVWLADADAYLIPMTFSDQLRRRMETSFPSKLIEFAQQGKPLLIWGPDYCSAVKWAVKGNRALCVTNPAAGALVKAVEELANSPTEQRRLAEAAREAARTVFNPQAIQRQFTDLLRKILAGTPQHQHT
jgi:glycosyltransferase involved in cell wall biosynthesis